MNWGTEQEALIRRNLWIDPRDAETSFEDFAEEWFDAVSPRLSPSTQAKYRSHTETHLIAKWGAWPAIGIFNGYIEIEAWVSTLHDDYSDPTVASIFATFSTIMKAMWRARMIPASPCTGIRVTNGEFETERLVSTPVQALRAAMRLYEMGIGLNGFTLCLADHYTGARWSELVGQQRHEYDPEAMSIVIREPLKEVNGAVSKGGVIVGSDMPPQPAIGTRPSRRLKKGGGPRRRPEPARWICHRSSPPSTSC